MTKKEKEILKALASDSRGLLSPGNFINDIAKKDRRSVENLIAEGYVEEVPQHKTNILGDKVITNIYDFYRATEKGIVQFEPFYQRVWFSFKNNISLYVGISSIILGAITIIVSSSISLYALRISQDGNNRANQEFQLRIRPYIIVDSIDTNFNTINKSTEYTLHIKNAGILPAKLIEKSASCINEEQIRGRKDFTGKSTVIGSDQIILDYLTISVEKAECEYMIKYKIAVDGFSVINYETSYTILHEFGQSPSMKNAKLK